MTDSCGCCEGIAQLTPTPIVNRPGLPALAYRAGIHATFLETMLARLSSLSIPFGELGPLLNPGDDPNALVYPLKALTTRLTDDPSIALLDAWATVADVFTFYQERIANEGYLRTATERRSILELARLVGYQLRPGVASSVFLSYTLDKGQQTTIPAGSRSQSIPGPGQLPQAFETSIDLNARADWNNLQPRMGLPPYITQLGPFAIDTNTTDGALYLQGTSTNLKKNDPVLFVFSDKPTKQVFERVQDVDPHAAEKYTRIIFPGEFTPLVFLRNVLDLVETYLDIAAFGVSPTDPGVDEIVPLLELIKAVLQLGEQLLVTLTAGQIPMLQVLEIVVAVALIGDLLLWLEHYLALIQGPGFSASAAFVVFDALQQIQKWMTAELALVQGTPIGTLLQAVLTALAQFMQQTTSFALQPFLQAAESALAAFTTTDAELQVILPAMITKLNTLSQQVPPPTLLDVLKAVQTTITPFLTEGSGERRELLQSINEDLDYYTNPQTNPQATEPNPIIVLKTVQETLAQFVTQSPAPPLLDTDMLALVQATQSMLTQLMQGQLAQLTTAALDTLFVAIQQAFEPFVLSFAPLFTDNPTVSQRLMQSQSTRQIVGQWLLRTAMHAPQLRSFFGVPAPGSSGPPLALARSDSSILPQQPVQDTLTVWCGLYQNAVQNNATAQATWIGELITAVKNLVNSLPQTVDLGMGFINLETNLDGICTPTVTSGLANLLTPLAKPLVLQPANSANLQRSLHKAFSRKGDIAPQLLSVLRPEVASSLYDAYGSTRVSSLPPLKSFNALRVKAAPFGSAAPKKSKTKPNTGAGGGFITDDGDEWDLALTDKDAQFLYLDAVYDRIVPESWIVIEYVPPVDVTSSDVQIVKRQMHKVSHVDSLARADYGMSAKITRLTLYEPWFTSVASTSTVRFTPFRGVTVYAQSEQLPLADSPITDDIAKDSIELDGLYDGLQSGRWVVVSGERTDIPNTSGITTSEPAMLAGVTHDVRQANPTAQVSATNSLDAAAGGNADPLLQLLNPAAQLDAAAPLPQSSQLPVSLPGDTIHTTIQLATQLTHTYKRATVTIAGNVVPATQGETRTQILGSGAGSQSMQQFALGQSPLTFVSAPTPTGEESTLKVYVNNIRWHETDNLAALGPTNRSYLTRTDDQDKVTVIFGDGEHGARLPTGTENVKALYRTGIGQSGNAATGQISMLVTRPLGVKAVVNPVPATGGADKEGRDQARQNVPLAVLALDRIVSVQDYADFARTFAGIGKASATSLPLGRQQVVYLTIAGFDNIPISTTSDLYRNLLLSLHQFGDPATPVRVAISTVKLLVVSAKVRVLPDYLFAAVAVNMRTALYAAFNFEQRALGQTLFQSEVVSVMQSIAGVEYIELDILDAVDQTNLLNALNTIHQEELQEATTGQKTPNPADLATLLNLRKRDFIRANLARPNPHPTTDSVDALLPAELVFLSADVPDTLILTELTSLRFTPSSRSQRTHKHGAKKQ